jgi:hypothetical protein
LLIDKVIAKHGVPLSLVSDRGTVFTAHFWSSVCHHAKIKRRLSTAFHPQTDGQTERQNQTLEQYLRSYVNYRQDDWAHWLPVAEFAYNNSVHSATGFSPYYALTGRHARLDVEYAQLDRDVPAARERIETLAKIRETLEKRLEDARVTQRRFALRKTKPKTYAPNDMVWLAGKHIHSVRPSKKLDYKYHGPFRVVEAVGPQAYRLDIAGHLSGIHPVFHVSLLEPVNRRGTEVAPTLHVELVNDEEEHEIKSIVDSKVSNRTLYYLVEWMGHSSEYNEWYAVQKLPHATEAIADFHRAHPTAVGPLEAERARKEGEAHPRGRPPNAPTKRVARRNTTGRAEAARRDTPAEPTRQASPTRKKRGRPRKDATSAAEASANTADVTQPRRRGRHGLRRQD